MFRLSGLYITMVTFSLVVISFALIFMVNPNIILPDIGPLSLGPMEKVRLAPNVESTEQTSAVSHSQSSVALPAQTKLMFFKTHKCGTSSLVSLLYLYGIRRDLNFVMTPYEHQFVYDKPVQKLSSGQKFDILCQHHRETYKWAYYRPQLVHQLLPKNQTFYFTILRDPQQQFISNFVFYKHGADVQKKHPEASQDQILELFFNETQNNPKDPGSVLCNRVINPMSFDLGFSRFLRKRAVERINQTLDQTVDEFIDFLTLEFNFVMITDYFDESLLMMKSYLGWEVDDVIYLKKMTRSKEEVSSDSKTTKPSTDISKNVESLLRKNNYVDYRIYDHFKGIFLQKLQSFNPKLISNELDELKIRQAGLVKTCLNETETRRSKLGTYSHPLSESGRQNSTCRLLTMSDVFVSKALSADQDRNYDAATFKDKEKYAKAIDSILQLFQQIRRDYSQKLQLQVFNES